MKVSDGPDRIKTGHATLADGSSVEEPWLKPQRSNFNIGVGTTARQHDGRFVMDWICVTNQTEKEGSQPAAPAGPRRRWASYLRIRGKETLMESSAKGTCNVSSEWKQANPVLNPDPAKVAFEIFFFCSFLRNSGSFPQIKKPALRMMHY